MQTKEIKSLNKLAFLLGLPREYLETLAERAPGLYHPYDIPKKASNSYRTIDNPSEELKNAQRRIEQRLLRPMVAELPKCMHGGRRGKSVATNALPHVANPCLLALDLSNCFGHITYEMVYTFYSNHLACTPPVAKILTKLTTIHNRLPQGGVTSPALCNLILEPLITGLETKATANGLDLTNYIDDIFVSGRKESLQLILPDLLSAIDASSFTINYNKLTLTSQNNSMKVTGVTTNKLASIGRKRIRNIERKIMHLSPTALGCYNEQIKHRINSIHGEILYAYSVNKRQGEHLRCKLMNRLGPYDITFPAL